MSKKIDMEPPSTPQTAPGILIGLEPDREVVLLREALQAQGRRVLLVAPQAVEEQLTRESWDVLVVDAAHGGRDLAGLSFEDPDGPLVILVTGFGTLDDDLAALASGVFDCVPRPTSAEQIKASVQRALEQRGLERENRRLRASMEERFSFGSFRTRDARTRRILEIADSVADTRANVLITGETGTGKSLLARMMHERSSRSEGPFVVVSCGALPEQLLESELFGHVRGAFTGAVADKLGRFEEAQGGTLFLDEIATASADMQVKLLRAVQERVIERLGSSEPRTVDVRLIFATHCDLAQEVEAGRFRQDLFYRIHVVALELPPLRDRPGDIPLLARSFLERDCAEYERELGGFTPEAMAHLCSASWPGNVRQLENSVERAVLLARGPQVGARDLSNDLVDHLLDGGDGADETFTQGGPSNQAEEISRPEPDLRIPGVDSAGTFPLTLKQALEGPERQILVAALEHNGWNRQQTAAMLGINRTTLFNKMRKYGLLGRPRTSGDALGESA